MAQEKILLATLTTDANGECTYTYTGSGAGKVDLIGEYRGFSSESYEIIDATFYDKGLSGSGNHNDNWTDNQYLVRTRGETYTTLSNNGSTWANTKPNNDSEIIGDFIIEWDNVVASSTAHVIFTGTSDSSINFNNMGATDNCKVRIEVKGLVARAYINGTFSKEYTITNRTGTGGLKVRIQFSTTDVKYSNFMIYTI